MKYKYCKKLGLFICHSKTVGDGGVEGNRELQLWNFGIILV